MSSSIKVYYISQVYVKDGYNFLARSQIKVYTEGKIKGGEVIDFVPFVDSVAVLKER